MAPGWHEKQTCYARHSIRAFSITRYTLPIQAMMINFHLPFTVMKEPFTGELRLVSSHADGRLVSFSCGKARYEARVGERLRAQNSRRRDTWLSLTSSPPPVARPVSRTPSWRRRRCRRQLPSVVSPLRSRRMARSVSRTSSRRVRSPVPRPSSSQPIRMSRRSVSPVSPWFPLVFPRPCPSRPPAS